MIDELFVGNSWCAKSKSSPQKRATTYEPSTGDTNPSHLKFGENTRMGAPGPPGGYDLHKYFRGPPQSPYPPQSAAYQPSSPGNSFHHQSSHSSYPPGNNPPSSYPSNSAAYSNLQGGSYTYNPTPPQQSGSPVYHGPQYIHYNQDLGLRQVPYSPSPFSQQPSQFSQPPSSPSHSNQPQLSLPMPSLSMSSQPTLSQSKFSQVSSSLPLTLPSSPASNQPLDGARLMALLTNQSGSQAGSDDDENPSIPGAPHCSPRLPLPSLRQTDVSHGVEMSGPPPPLSPALPTAPPVPSATQGRPPPKIPRGRYLRGDHTIHDVDVRKPGETPPQLEVSPITVYGSDPTLVLGRQIAVNQKFICYGLRGGTIRILNVNSAQRALLRGHIQRVSDMAFFSENAPLLASASEDGRIFVRQIHEATGEDGKLTESLLLAVQFVGDWEMCHPRLCWHPTTQDIIFVAIGNYVVRVDMSRTGQATGPGGFNPERPLECRLDNPLRGVSVAGQHDDVVTELAVPLSGPVRLASASKDGTVRIWGDQRQCLSKFEPYEGNAVDAVSYLSAPRGADRQFLVSAGPLNRDLRLWSFDELSSKSGQGIWRCIQALEFQSGSKPEQAFYNQVVVSHRAGLILVANAQKNAIYAIHVDFGPAAVAPRMDYLAEFSVAIPILSLTVADDAVSEGGEGILKVFCVQTQAIQQYTLDLSQCLPPIIEDLHSEGSTPSTPKKGLAQGTPTSTFTTLEKGHQNLMTISSSTLTGMTNVSSLSANPGIPPRPSAFGSFVELGNRSPLYGTTETNRVSETTKLTSTTISKDSRDGAGKPTTPGAHSSSEAGLPSGVRLNMRPEVAREGLLSSNLAKPPTPPPRRRSRSRSPAKAADVQYIPMYPGFSRHKAEKAEAIKDIWLEGDAAEAPTASTASTAQVDIGHSSLSSNPMGDETYDKEEREGPPSGNGMKLSTFHQLGGSHLISPSDIMSLAASNKGETAETREIAPNLMDAEDWQDESRSSLATSLKEARVKDKVVEISESLLDPRDHVDNPSTSLPASFDGEVGTSTDFVAKDLMIENDGESTSGLDLPGPRRVDDAQSAYYTEDKQRPNSDDLQYETKSTALKQGEAGAGAPTVQSQTSALKGRRSKNKNSGPSPSVPLPTSSYLPIVPSSVPPTVSEGEPESTLVSVPLDPSLIAQVATMQESLNQFVAIQKDLQKQMTILVAVPVAKETKRLEGAFGQRMEKVLKANVDAVWARLAEENVKREKQDRDKAQQVNTLLNNFISKDMPVALERGLKKEFAAIGPSVAQTLVLPLQKSVSTAVSETFQKSAIDKILPQLEKAAVTKLEASMTRQLKTQFQTSGRQALHEALIAGLESLVIPTFDRSCRAMSEQLETAFQTGMAEYTSHAQQQLSSTNSALATSLQEIIGGAASLAKVLNDELLDSTAKLMQLVEAASTNTRYGENIQMKGDLPDQAHSLQHLEESLDPTIELNRLLQEGKYEEAFNKALSSGDLPVVSWLCLQLDPVHLLSAAPLPVSQGVLLSLVRQLSFDLLKDTRHKLLWIKEASLALNPSDPHLGPHMRGFLEQTYQNCHQLMGATKIQSEQSALRLVIHVINSLLSSCK